MKDIDQLERALLETLSPGESSVPVVSMSPTVQHNSQTKSLGASSKAKEHGLDVVLPSCTTGIWHLGVTDTDRNLFGLLTATRMKTCIAPRQPQDSYEALGSSCLHEALGFSN